MQANVVAHGRTNLIYCGEMVKMVSGSIYSWNSFYGQISSPLSYLGRVMFEKPSLLTAVKAAVTSHCESREQSSKFVSSRI